MGSLTRSCLREHIFKNVFSAGIRDKESPKEYIYLYLSFTTDENDNRLELTESDADYISRKSEAVILMKDDLDALISEYAKDWTINRIGKTELAILRLALYEMLYDDDIPENVAINEAVELAKKYGEEMSPGFINGILSTAKERAAGKVR